MSYTIGYAVGSIRNELPLEFGDIYLQGVTGFYCVFDESLESAGAHYSAVLKKEDWGVYGYRVCNFPTFKHCGAEVLYTEILVDGQVHSNNFDIEVLPYKNPEVELQASRCDSDGTPNPKGNYIYMAYNYTISDVNGMNGLKSIKLQKTIVGTEDWQDVAVPFTTVADSRIVGGFDANTDYELRLIVQDKVTREGLSQINLTSGKAFIDFKSGGDGIAFGKIATRVGFDCGMDMYYKNKEILDLIYPVGSIYMSVNDTNPSNLFGGSWERYALGRTLVGVGQSEQYFGEFEQGGFAVTQVAEHSHGKNFGGEYTEYDGNHNHEFKYHTIGAGGSSRNIPSSAGGYSTSGQVVAHDGNHRHYISEHYHGATGWTNEKGNMPPYITCYIWRRVG